MCHRSIGQNVQQRFSNGLLLSSYTRLHLRNFSRKGNLILNRVQRVPPVLAADRTSHLHLTWKTGIYIVNNRDCENEIRRRRTGIPLIEKLTKIRKNHSTKEVVATNKGLVVVFLIASYAAHKTRYVEDSIYYYAWNIV